MKTLDEIKAILQAQKKHLSERYGVQIVGVFGSYVRNEQRPESDVDILIELETPLRFDLLDWVNLENYLGELLDTKVDVTIKSDLRKRIGQRILREVICIE